MFTQSRLVSSTTVILAILLYGSQALAVDLSRGRILSMSCSACHGTDGKSPGTIPSIRGKSAAYIETAMKQFRSGKRPSTVMGRHAKGYTDAEIKLIAEYFGKLK